MATKVYRFRAALGGVGVSRLAKLSASTPVVTDTEMGEVVDLTHEETDAEELKTAMSSFGYSFLDEDPTSSIEDVAYDAHKTLLHLIHFVDSGPADEFPTNAYCELTPNTLPGALFPTEMTWWQDVAKTKKYVELEITRNAQQVPTQEVWRMYESDGVTVGATLIDTYTLLGGVFQVDCTRQTFQPFVDDYSWATDAVNKYVTTNGQPIVVTGDLTLTIATLWKKTIFPASERTLWVTGSSKNFSFTDIQDNLRLYVNTSGQTNRYNFAGDGLPVVGEWCLSVIVWKASEAEIDRVRYYHKVAAGAFIEDTTKSVTGTIPTQLTSGGSMGIGARVGGGQPLGIQVSEHAVWSDALTLAQVTELVASPLAGNTPAITDWGDLPTTPAPDRLWYRFGDTVGDDPTSTVIDVSGAGKDGLPFNMIAGDQLADTP